MSIHRGCCLSKIAVPIMDIVVQTSRFVVQARFAARGLIGDPRQPIFP
jgi:hypothetical protein